MALEFQKGRNRYSVECRMACSKYIIVLCVVLCCHYRLSIVFRQLGNSLRKFSPEHCVHSGC